MIDCKRILVSAIILVHAPVNTIKNQEAFDLYLQVTNFALSPLSPYARCLFLCALSPLTHSLSPHSPLSVSLSLRAPSKSTTICAQTVLLLCLASVLMVRVPSLTRYAILQGIAADRKI
ncbi:hypothetical protein O6H91_23G062900 [Diphasiastrum complanatum]|uniref:Uncharacterized protein n=1 Tax=Diphasiastrum complanatum TaxID=34168 RepID=A0ACC2ABE1_DIPCM|nr:hypothetical protein O6H91_23G062900 [Diphasiastrum complanatum]